MYRCSKCGLAVVVLPEKVIRACKHDAPIIAYMGCSVKGTSVIKTGKK
jgi:hypothetical protein